jgi:hypothetical protein
LFRMKRLIKHSMPFFFHISHVLLFFYYTFIEVYLDLFLYTSWMNMNSWSVYLIFISCILASDPSNIFVERFWSIFNRSQSVSRCHWIIFDEINGVRFLVNRYRCPRGWQRFGGSCYHLSNVISTITNANHTCNLYYLNNSQLMYILRRPMEIYYAANILVEHNFPVLLLQIDRSTFVRHEICKSDFIEWSNEMVVSREKFPTRTSSLSYNLKRKISHLSQRNNNQQSTTIKIRTIYPLSIFVMSVWSASASQWYSFLVYYWVFHQFIIGIHLNSILLLMKLLYQSLNVNILRSYWSIIVFFAFISLILCLLFSYLIVNQIWWIRLINEEKYLLGCLSPIEPFTTANRYETAALWGIVVFEVLTALEDFLIDLSELWKHGVLTQFVNRTLILLLYGFVILYDHCWY